MMLALVSTTATWALRTLVPFLLLYVVIRQAVFRGLRAHDRGKG